MSSPSVQYVIWQRFQLKPKKHWKLICRQIEVQKNDENKNEYENQNDLIQPPCDLNMIIYLYCNPNILCCVCLVFFCPIHRCLASLIFLSAICSTQFFLFFFFRFEFTTVQNKNYANSTHCDISVAGFWILIVVGVGVVQQQQRLL